VATRRVYRGTWAPCPRACPDNLDTLSMQLRALGWPDVCAVISAEQLLRTKAVHTTDRDGPAMQEPHTTSVRADAQSFRRRHQKDSAPSTQGSGPSYRWLQLKTVEALARLGRDQAMHYALSYTRESGFRTMSATLRYLLHISASACLMSGCGRIGYDAQGDSADLRVLSLTLNEEAGSTSTGLVSAELEAVGSEPLVAWCVLVNDRSPPAEDDPCWTDVATPNTALAVSRSEWNIAPGLLPGPYAVTGWVRSRSGATSSLSADGRGTLAVDRAIIDLIPPAMAPVTDVLATNTDTPSAPPTPADLSVASGGDFFVSWRHVDDGGTPTDHTIGLFVTTDEVAWSPIASDLPNAAAEGCTPPAGATGCARVVASAPADGYFRVRVGATDSMGRTVFGSSVPLNTPQTQFLAGSTDPGLGGHALGFTLFPLFGLNRRQLQAVVIDDGGTMFLADIERGIFRIDPADGVPRLFLAQTGTATGDGGLVKDATAHTVLHIALDYAGALLIFDRDRIRRVDLATGIIDTFIGGGSNASNDAMGPEEMELEVVGIDAAGRAIFTPVPNGDLYFMSRNASANPIRHYQAETGLVRTILPSGTGYGPDPTVDLSLCSTTSAAVIFAKGEPDAFLASMVDGPCSERGLARLTADGMSQGPHPDAPPGSSVSRMDMGTSRVGTVYGYDSTSVDRFSATTGAWTRILGAGPQGSCVDETDALSCNIYFKGLFVDGDERVTFLDYGRVRFIDRSGRVQAMIGWQHSTDEGLNAHSARLGVVRTLGRSDMGEVIFADRDAVAFRSVADDGSGNVTTLAGTGQESRWNTTDPALGQPVTFQVSGTYLDFFVVDPPTGDILFTDGISALHRLVRSTGLWTPVVDGSTTPWYLPAADGALGSEIDYHATYNRPLAINAGQVLVSKSDYLPPRRPFLKTYDTTDGTQGHVIGVDDDIVGFPADGAINASSHATSVDHGASWDGTGWLVVDQNTIRRIDGSNISTVATQAERIGAFARRPTTGADILYTCGSSSGEVHELDLSLGSSPTPRSIDLGHPSIECAGRTMIYDPLPVPRLILPVTQHGMHAIVAVELP
jgi:hypothetical protein